MRIETRFVDSDAGSELLVRIYPDQVSVDAHEPELTDGETADAQSYWGVVWRAGKSPPDDSQIKAAWRDLVTRYHAPRAAWIVAIMTPTNLGAQPTAPTPDGTDPVPPPSFPNPPKRATSWNRAARAVLLPDAWTVVAQHAGGTIIQRSASIQGDPAVTLDPSNASAFPNGSTVDAGMQWMVNFDAAVTAGMALRIPLDQQTRIGGIDTLFVYGVRAGDTDSAVELQALFDAHHYSDGLAIVPQGAPTNNTPDASSAWKINESEISYAVEQLPIPPIDPETDAARLTSALGFDPLEGTFDRIAYGRDYGGRNGRDMLTALWPATLGYFLQEMMAPTFSYNQIDAGRRWTLDHIIPRGPLPAIRIGKTPYAVLPTAALSFYPKDQPRLIASIEPDLVALLRRLLEAWVASIPAAPHIGAGDPDQNLLHVLGMDASSMKFHGRNLIGENFIVNWQIFAGIPDAARIAWWTIQAALAREAITKYGSPSWNPFILSVGYSGDQYELRYPTVCDKPLSETDPLDNDAVIGATKVNYIDWLRTAPVDDIRFERYPGAAVPTSLLYKLLRQSVLREYADIPSRAEVAAGRLTLEEVREPELLNVSQTRATMTSYDILARPSIDNPALSWAEFLVQLEPTPESPYARLAELRASLAHLSALPTAELDRLLTETLDLCSYRLDAWLTGVVNALLQRVRSEREIGLHVGGYGWVENVRPAAPRPDVTGHEREAVARLDALRARKINVASTLRVPKEPHTDNGGYIHAPSYGQAAAGAVLRAGYMTHRGTSTEPLLSIDLSSERIARALWVLDGVRGGQRLSALLGYRFEAELEARGLQVYLQPFRDRFPMMGTELTPTDPAAESVSASDVVDALALRQAFDSNQLVPGSNWGPRLPPPGPDQDQVVALLHELDDIMDALSDLSVSEAVFQVMRGNFERAGGLLDAVSKGTYAPDPEVVKTQRSGIDITHRVMVLFAGIPTKAPGWDGISPHPRALAEPSLDAWVGTLLPDPRQVRCTVSFTDQNGTTTTQIMSLADLDLGPLDMLALADTGQNPQRSELEERIRYRAALSPQIDKVAITFARDGLPDGSITFPEALIAARSVRALVGSARPLQPEDLCETQVNAVQAGGAIDLTELQGRLSALLTRFDADRTALQTTLAGLPGTLDSVRTALIACSYYGIGGSIPATSTGPDSSLPVRAKAVLDEMAKRRTAIAAMPNVTAADAMAIIKTVFGGTIVVLSRFQAPNVSILHAAFVASASLLPAADKDAIALWIQQLTHVRPAIARLDSTSMLTQLLKGSAPLQLTLGQLPMVSNDRWLGLPFDGASPPSSGRVAIAAIPAGNITAGNDYAGLLIDEWPERIPVPKQSAAVSFHYEEPKSRAPQALLLAVCPDNREVWDDELILATLQETLQLAKIRAVDLDTIIDIGQILPALYVPFNLQQATIATRLRMNSSEVERYNELNK
jgi:hypothetical protein